MLEAGVTHHQYSSRLPSILKTPEKRRCSGPFCVNCNGEMLASSCVN
jgi:hypothetical protein